MRGDYQLSLEDNSKDAALVEEDGQRNPKALLLSTWRLCKRSQSSKIMLWFIHSRRVGMKTYICF